MVVGFREKPVYDFRVSMGVYVFNRSLLDRVPTGVPYGFDDLVLGMLKDKGLIHAYNYEGYWLDIGRPDDYDKANQDIEKLQFLKEN
jgi:NDP-sugar pyrophosphorylase family protein